MDAHFRAFSFVDRITSFQEGRQICGTFAIPPGQQGFPMALVGEAVGQLAAWAAMSEVRFEYRPVAGLAGSIELCRVPGLCGVLQLTADLEQVDTESVAYSGSAHLDGEPIIQLRDCVGPMVRLADFDDPEALRGRFELLCHQGAQSGLFPGLPALELEQVCKDSGQRVTATFQVPSSADFFEDHFPRRHVFPGSLLMHLSLQLGAVLAEELGQPGEGHWVAAEVKDLKLRTFIPPGEILQLQARVKQASTDRLSLALDTRVGNDIIATAGLLLTRRGPA